MFYHIYGHNHITADTDLLGIFPENTRKSRSTIAYCDIQSTILINQF